MSFFWQSVEPFSDRPALLTRGVEVTYGALVKRASAIASVLMATARDGAAGRCALLGAKGVGTYAGALGILEAGCTYVPLNTRFPRARTLEMLELADVRAIVVAEDALDLARPLLAEIPSSLDVVLAGSVEVPSWASEVPWHRFWTEPAEMRADELPRPVPAEEAYLLFTSGSTGIPKGIAVTQENAFVYIESVCARYQATERDRVSQSFDLTFDLSIHDMFVCWSGGGCLVPMPASGGLGTSSFIRRNEITIWFGVPSTASVMARTGELQPGSMPSLRWSLFCGEALPARLAKAWALAAPGSAIENLYGPTETTMALTVYRVPKDASEEGVVPIGWALPGQTIAIIGEDGSVLPDGEVGEICLGGSQVAPGYWRRPDLTADRFRGPAGVPQGMRWYRTGDLGVMTAEHGLVFRGRADKQVKIRGFRVELQEIESAIRAAGRMDLVAVLPWPLDADGAASSVVGFVMRGSPCEEILSACRMRLPHYMVPSRLVEVEDWPLNVNRKTDYKALTRMLSEKVDV